MTKIKVTELEPWRAVLIAPGLWQVVDMHGATVTVPLDGRTALLVASAPTVLRFLSLFMLRPGAPAFVDVTNMLARAGIELEL